MRLIMHAALFAAISLATQPAFAEEDEIVVTATRAPTSANRLPAHVDVIDRDDIEAEALVSLTEALGAEAVQAGDLGQQASLFLRGGNSKHALALFDGVRLNDASTPNAQYDFGQDTLGAIERVEILRGPASAIYGSDAIGGVVNLIPRRGGEHAFAPFLELSGGSFATVRGLAGAQGSAGGFDYGLSAEVLTTDGYDLVPERMATHTGDEDGAEASTFVASARYDTGRLAFDGLLRVRDSRAEFDTFSGGDFFDLRADDPDLETEASQRLWRLGAEAALAPAVTVRLAGGQVLSDREELDGAFSNSTADATRDFADLSATYASARATFAAGFAFERNAIDTTSLFSDPLSAEENQSAFYVNGLFDVSERVTLSGSVRIDDYESFGTHSTYAVGAVAHLGDARVFASYGTAFKAPSLSERFETSFFNIGNPDLEPEEAQLWELGADWRFNERISAGASYYQTRIDNLIEYQFAQTQNVNVGEAEIDGAEAFIEYAPTTAASIRVAYTWTDARNGVTGAQLARRPEQAWRLDARAGVAANLTLALRWTYVGERTDVTYSDAGAFLSAAGAVEAFNVGALSATYGVSEGVQIFARIDNITDETYEQPAAFAGAPRNGSIGLRAVF